MRKNMLGRLQLSDLHRMHPHIFYFLQNLFPVQDSEIIRELIHRSKKSFFRPSPQDYSFSIMNEKDCPMFYFSRFFLCFNRKFLLSS